MFEARKTRIKALILENNSYMKNRLRQIDEKPFLFSVEQRADVEGDYRALRDYAEKCMSLIQRLDELENAEVKVND